MMHAHTQDFAHGSPALWIGLALLLVGGLMLSDRRRAGPRSVWVLALLVAVFGFESAVHSAHHLGDPQGADTCTLFSGAKHVEAASSSVPDAGGGLRVTVPAAPVEADSARPPKTARTHEGRAPPTLSSAP